MSSKNKLRHEKNIKFRIYVGIIVFLLLLCCGLYIAYEMMCYTLETGKTAVSIYDLPEFCNYLASPLTTVAIDFETIITCFKYQATKLWWLYASAAFAVFLAATSNTKDEFRGMEHGSASWAEKYDEKQFKDNKGIPIGLNTYVSIENCNNSSYMPHNLNELVIGGSGARKTFGKIQPDIMQMFGSYVVTDPKGELYRNTAKFLAANGYKIRVLNLIDIHLSNSYNPFAYMQEEQDVINVADLFMKNSAGEGEKEDFWTGAAHDMLVAIMVYLWKTSYELKTFGRAIRLVNSVQYKDGKIDELCELARCLKNHAVEHPNDVAAVNWASIQGTPQETLGSICKVLSTRLRLWADEMDFDSIGKEKTAVFMLIKVPRNPYKVISNIFYSQLFERLMLVANRDFNGCLPLLVSCELDEFPNLGKIPDYSETLAIVRSHNIRICTVLQGLSQLKALYEKTWESIVSNCSIFTFLGTNDMDSREYVTKKLGKTTVKVDTRSYNRGSSKGGGGGSDSENYIQRDLLTPDEIPRAIRPKGKTKRFGGSCIVFVDEFKPFFLSKFDTLHHHVMCQTGSKYKKDVHNNTYIENVYASVREERHKNHRQVLKDFFEKSKEQTELAEAEYEAELLASEAEEQERLRSQYSEEDFEEITYDDDNIEADFENQASEDVNPIMDNFKFGDDE